MNSRQVRFRLSLVEHHQLEERARNEGETVSDLIREALYQRYRIGSFAACSVVASTAQPPSCNTPRK
jgi:hypothetical protein